MSETAETYTTRLQQADANHERAARQEHAAQLARVSRLEAENEALRQALRKLVRAAEKLIDVGTEFDWDTRVIWEYEDALHDNITATAALLEEPDGNLTR